jgi:hypothetical protein
MKTKRKLKSFDVCASELNYYLSKRIKAHDKDEAAQIYAQMIQDGMVEVVNSEMPDLSVREVL